MIALSEFHSGIVDANLLLLSMGKSTSQSILYKSSLIQDYYNCKYQGKYQSRIASIIIKRDRPVERYQTSSYEKEGHCIQLDMRRTIKNNCQAKRSEHERKKIVNSISSNSIGTQAMSKGSPAVRLCPIRRQRSFKKLKLV